MCLGMIQTNNCIVLSAFFLLIQCNYVMYASLEIIQIPSRDVFIHTFSVLAPTPNVRLHPQFISYNHCLYLHEAEN